MKDGRKRVFLDYTSITPIDGKVAAEVQKVQKKFWANASSLHTEGESAKNVLEEARTKIARVLHCRSNEIFFTSGGTESLNLAIEGVVKASIEKLPHIITSAIEHPAVLEPIKSLLKEKKVEVSFIVPNEKGIINPESVKKEIKENTVLVAVQHANNEIGTIQSIRKIAEIIKISTPNPSPWQGEGKRERTPYLLVDACQSVLYENVSAERLGADLLVLDGIKMYGPRGSGVLMVKRGVNISPVIFGGGQERGLRPGTENISAAAGLAKALEIAVQKREKESSRLAGLRDYAIAKILKKIPGTSLNGGQENRLPNNINICLPGQDSEFLVIKLDTLGFAVSAASACHTLSLENGSYVIESIGPSTSSGQVNRECASSSLRITLGRDTKKSDLDKFISTLKKIIK